VEQRKHVPGTERRKRFMNLLKQFLPFIIPLVLIMFFLLWVSDRTTDSTGSINKTTAAPVDSVSVDNLGDSVVLSDPCTLIFIDCASSSQSESGIRDNGVISPDSPVVLK